MRKRNKLNAVIVDDYPLVRLAIKNLLESEGILVVAETGDGTQPLLLVGENYPNLVFLDVDMAVMSGMDVSEILRKKAFSRIIIVVSAKNELFYGRCSADAGKNAFISNRGE